jgi:hypothetical protein
MSGHDLTRASSLSALAGDPELAKRELADGQSIVVTDDDQRVVGVLVRPTSAFSDRPVGGGFSRINRGQMRSFDDLRGWALRWVLACAAAVAAAKLLVPEPASETVGAVAVVTSRSVV